MKSRKEDKGGLPERQQGEICRADVLPAGAAGRRSADSRKGKARRRSIQKKMNRTGVWTQTERCCVHTEGWDRAGVLKAGEGRSANRAIFSCNMSSRHNFGTITVETNNVES